VAVARSAATLIPQHDYSHIIDWYRETLPNVAPPRKYRWEPVRIGPTWDWSPDRGWLLPEHSMGWGALGWCGYWLRNMRGEAWEFTPEQARFLLHYDGLDETGRLLSRTAVLQRMKGHGKDPFACALSCFRAFGPTIFDHFGSDGQPVGRDDEAAWIQVTAVSKEQTQNTMKLFPVMLSQEARKHFAIQIGRENVWGLGDTRQIQATSSNFLALEGNRVSQAIRNEPQNWNSSNQGHDLAGTISGNSTKIPGGIGRILDIENAYRPGEDSVAERVRDAWEATQANEHRAAKARSFGLLYDSLEAAADAPLTADDAPEVLESVRGDSVWLDIPAIVEDIVNGANTPSESRRKWYNQITATADSWTTPQQFDLSYRDEDPRPGDQIVMFGDGSKSDDNTALVACRISDGLTWPLGIWKPINDGRIDRWVVDRRVVETFELYDVVGFWFDPSDARDDETGERYWEPLCDQWAQTYRRKLSRLPAVKTGFGQHLVVWDMRNPIHLKAHTEACERALSDIVDGTAFHNCSLGKPGLGVKMRQHIVNAKRANNKFGVGIRKEHRESRKKIDAAACFVGARMMRNYYNGLAPKGRVPGDGRVITY
jgi:hypothetical protein